MVADRIEIEMVTTPGRRYRVDRARFMAMKDALFAVLPDTPPGMTPAEAQKALLAHLSPDLFPGGAKAGWWMKAVQLDQEAKGILARGPKAPVRLWRTGKTG